MEEGVTWVGRGEEVGSSLIVGSRYVSRGVLLAACVGGVYFREFATSGVGAAGLAAMEILAQLNLDI